MHNDGTLAHKYIRLVLICDIQIEHTVIDEDIAAEFVAAAVRRVAKADTGRAGYAAYVEDSSSWKRWSKA
ncbi:uncharacterized protein N7515_009220 [Penicillium bovifimosum]|uniref:Uncharacterized protein n=1 Tax=Penicillium bovifimosum TaxID=126998 RepID=A0A9W9GJZ4_9EURO|nr:uncharacterized protein N7515_009220 [Penicillium bovifimosum]KAJ5121259.1 hypothetical protein N7515_009220 [Penicillium bovifimosum]